MTIFLLTLLGKNTLKRFGKIKIFGGTGRKEKQMERDFEKDIMELDAAIKSNAERDNTFTLSVLQRAKEIILQQQAKLATYEDTGWVPIAERLPDRSGDYWVTMRHLDGSVTTVKMFWSHDWPHEDAWNEVVVAWRPYYYPEPFVSQN